ncbi:hypothetical protein [Sphingomonas oryzagri]|jgi:hypothetical protein|uniref:Uncharacterized protein n=1 Tax=Sphingomonas oryzagri TaxID=3042314 RepID=A0ABT6MYU5_9SPHN|nr:hypothetical protein [Sphingomonas oryzagri]MDH7638127.1 hypothetical protein [Sphingomonas oryzagri]
MASELEPSTSDHDMTLRHGTQGERAYEFDKHRQWLRKWSDERAYVELGSFYSIIGSRLGRCGGKAPNSRCSRTCAAFLLSDGQLSIVNQIFPAPGSTSKCGCYGKSVNRDGVADL